jgi:hypothetical protein
VDDAARVIAAPAGDERAVEPAVAATAERPAPPAVRAVLAREVWMARLGAVGGTLVAALCSGMPVREMAPWVVLAFDDPTVVNLIGLAFGSLVTSVLVLCSGGLVWGTWRTAVAASRDAREAVYLETTGPVQVDREVDGEGDSSCWLAAGGRRFGITETLHDRLLRHLSDGRIVVVAHTKRTERLLWVRQAAADGGGALTDVPVPHPDGNATAATRTWSLPATSPVSDREMPSAAASTLA